MKESNLIVDKSMDFAVRIVNLYKYLTKEKSEYILSKQLLRSDTSIGANVNEAIRAQSQADSIFKDCESLIKILVSIIKTTKKNS